MSKYIDYDAIDYRNDRLHDKSEEFLNGVIYMAQRIEDAPSIDIVRCSECIHNPWNVDSDYTCIWDDDFANREQTPDDFCSYGERE